MSKYAIISASSLGQYDFSYLGNIRKSLDETLAVVEWDGPDPVWVSELSASVLTQDQTQNIMRTSVWSLTSSS